MTGLELQSSDFGSNRSTNWSTTTVQGAVYVYTYSYGVFQGQASRSIAFQISSNEYPN